MVKRWSGLPLVAVDGDRKGHRSRHAKLCLPPLQAVRRHPRKLFGGLTAANLYQGSTGPFLGLCSLDTDSRVLKRAENTKRQTCSASRLLNRCTEMHRKRSSWEKSEWKHAQSKVMPESPATAVSPPERRSTVPGMNGSPLRRSGSALRFFARRLASSGILPCRGCRPGPHLLASLPQAG